ncbi:hypothetical protein NF27_GJ00030 [Candidatus Jidaibacter acanthamoeba]|uniref:Uncharacterized protein n=1 Tax=Candidatus Jidaibacter acanthamoebae TaxID=86105 RepID=A0A0C1QKN0_9RICK|nr:hypothetical protein [Candidatus Jidaibacter acanthamoeba]KIE04693.1 hypothetical protein NF27_GJ00030 [Candidatus Jidaibacter acanthamoeba]
MVENKLENDLLSHENSAEEILKESECNYDSYINSNVNSTIPEPVLSVPPEYTAINNISPYIISLHTISPNIIYEKIIVIIL